MNTLAGAFGEVRRIAVFRALVLGDMLCAVPALRAVRAAWPGAEITLVGLPWARQWVERSAQVDRFIEFPGFPGLPERGVDALAWPAFLHEVQSRRFDLALQLHGSGTLTNPLVALFNARHVAGFAGDGVWAADRATHCGWPESGDEIERLLHLTDHLGLARQGTHLEFPVQASDDASLCHAWPDVNAADSIVCVHAGAQLPSRRWPPERFAAVADVLAAAGHTVVLTGTQGEAGLVAQVASAMRHPCVNLAGRTSLWSLGALLRHCRLLVCNDTGVSHVAAALGTPSVVVSLGADVSRWAPRDRARHRVLWQAMSCRPCAHVDCPVGHGCATAITAHQVVGAAEELLEAAVA